VKIVVDHVAGSRRGQRQEFSGQERLSIGRHPKCDVSFDAHRDLDASSRHAELRSGEEGYVLHDVGSSNGTFVGGERVSEIPVPPGQSVVVEFGSGGPQLRIWVGEDDMAPEPLRLGRPFPWRWVVLAVLLGVAAGLVILRLSN
jgi:hypothetical protein